MNIDKLNEYKKGFPSRSDVLERTPDPNVREMLGHLEDIQVQTAFDRFDCQKPHCNFGLAGTCCRNCNMGPCRITAKSPLGVCGASADLIVARNLLRSLAAGVAGHGARSREVILTLKAAAQGQLNLPILGVEKVIAVSKALGVYQESKTVAECAEEIADILLEDMSRTVPGTHRTLQALAPPERIETWRNLDILPIGSYHEVFEALNRTGVGTDGDWENVMVQLLRCGLAFAWNSVVGGALAQDCLYGPPKRSHIATNFGAIEPDYVNIALHGHSPVLPSAVVNASQETELQELARERGASGIRFYGICCSGLGVLYRQGGIPPLSNAMGAELIMGTGALDVWIADVQDIFPAIMQVASCFHTKVVTTSDSAKLPGAIHLGFDHTHSNLNELHEIARRIVHIGIENFSQRRHHQVFIPKFSLEAEVGFSAENIFAAFGGVNKMLTYIQQGEIRGIVNLVGCNNPKVLYEEATLKIADILLANNYLILTNGCASFPLMKMGYCSSKALSKAGTSLRQVTEKAGIPPVLHLGECLDNARASALFRALADNAGLPLKKMPFAFVSPEWSNEKGIGAALSFRLLGLNSYHCIYGSTLGSDNVSQFFSDRTQALLGSIMVVETDPNKLAHCIINDLETRLSGLMTIL